MSTVIKIIMCHAVGDYLFQSDYLAANKGRNWYILFIHCVLYCIPFAICFNLTWRILILFVSHIVIDAIKARYKKINLEVDQVLHYIIAATLYLFTM